MTDAVRSWQEIELDRIRAAVSEADREKLESIAIVASETLAAIDDWIGNEGSRTQAADSLYRLSRSLCSIRVRVALKNVHWRGTLVGNLERAGWRLGEDGAIHRGRHGVTLEEFTRTADSADANLRTALGVLKQLIECVPLLPDPFRLCGEEYCAFCGREMEQEVAHDPDVHAEACEWADAARVYYEMAGTPGKEESETT